MDLMKYLSIALIWILANASSLQGQGTQLLRQPTISDKSVVFVYANDLWSVNRDGGQAIRLTSNEGYESLPHFSPDEKWIAFSGQYGGNTDVYVIPAIGGTPQRLTWHPSGDFVQGWTPDGQVMFRSGRKSRPTQTNKFYTISLDGGLPKAVDIPRAAFGEISADGSHIAYVPITFWDPEWRNYRGGQAMPIWIVNMSSKELIRTPQPTQERHLDPVWHGGKVYYLSERDYASNIWMFDPVTKAEKQITFHKKFDIKSLDACQDQIVYEQGGYLHLLNPSTGNTKQMEIDVHGDMNFARERWESVSAGNLSNPNISPTAKRAIFEYRGEIFTIPKEKGTWRNLTNSPGVADRSPIWSPKGNQVAWFSDEGGEYQLIVADQNGQNKRKIKIADPTFYFKPVWSPDGSFLAFTDTHFSIWICNISTGSLKKVDTDGFAHPIRSMNPIWSPDSKWIAYAKQLENQFKAAFVYNINTNEKIQVTDGMSDVVTPVWDQNGKYLYFLASTDYGLNTGWLDMSSYDPQIKRSLYCAVLSKDDDSPKLVLSDEEEVSEEESDESDESDEAEDDDDEGVAVQIDADGLGDRIVALDLEAKSYLGLISGPENSVFISEGEIQNPKSTVHKYDVEEMKATEFDSDVTNIVSAYDGANLLYQKNGSWYLVEASSAPGPETKPLKMDAQIRVDPKAEYHQIFREGWRYMRDFLYVDNTHGAPWDQIYEWYSPWINHVRHRTDLNYVVDIMSGEISVGHSYVGGGDLPDLDRVPVGLLGCDFTVDQNHFQIDKIYTGERWNPGVKAPLHQPGLKVEKGDYLLAINGIPLSSRDNPYQLLAQTSGRATSLTVNNLPSLTGAREVIVEPVASEFQLRGFDWIEANRRKVDELSNGQLAYVYIPNTGGRGFEYFNRYFFSQQDKKGVILDERNNGGGSAADYMIDVLSRPLFGYFNSKAGNKKPWTTPMAGIWGPKVMIINERAGSGGDLLPYMFHAAELGPLVGTRTWGGLVGTWDTPLFIDGGRMVAPRGGFFDINGEWAVEGKGIAPDIEVIQDPKSVLMGKDPQLERAVREALDLLAKNPVVLKKEPPAPKLWKRPEGG